MREFVKRFISLNESDLFNQALPNRNQNFLCASIFNFSGIMIPSRFLAIPDASEPASASEAGIIDKTTIPCNVGSPSCLVNQLFLKVQTNFHSISNRSFYFFKKKSNYIVKSGSTSILLYTKVKNKTMNKNK